MGPILNDVSDSYFDSLDWSREDVIDDPDDHVKVWAVESTDEDGFIWGSEESVIDGHYSDGVEMDNLEVYDSNNFFVDQIKEAFINKGFHFEIDRGDNIKTDADEEDLKDLFPSILQYKGSGDKGEFLNSEGETIKPLYSIRFDFRETETSLMFIKNEDGSKFWSII